MKRTIILLFTIILFGCVGAYAQTANRKGFFVDVQGGAVLGYMYKSEYEKDGKPEVYSKGGMDMGIGVGYRFRTSRHWAFQTKVAFSDYLSKADIFNIAVMLGMRWTSNDFANNKSAFLGLNTGCSLYISGVGIYIPIDFEAGLNLSRKISLGLFVCPRICADIGYREVVINDYHWEYADYQTYTLLGVRFGYRF